MFADQAEISRLKIQVNEALRRVEETNRHQSVLQKNINVLMQERDSAPPAPSSNQLWNGEQGHSVNSWFDAAYVTTDKAKECAFFFSNDAMTVGQTLSETDARTSSANKTLKTNGYGALSAHSAYDKVYSDWDAGRGQSRLQGTKTIDTPLPHNSIEAEMVVFVQMIVAKRSQFIEIPESLRIFCGIFDNTAGQRDWLKGSVGLQAAPSDNTGTTERRYRLYIETDRGYSILSPEVVVANGYSDSQFAAGKSVSLSWNNAGGYLRVTVWRYTPSTGTYHVLEEFSSGASTFTDNNAFQNRVPAPSAYPAAGETERKAIFWTTTGNLVGMATDGATWDSFKARIEVPNNYNKALTTDRQWVRLGANQACNLLVTGCTTDGSDILTAPSNVFEAAYSTLFAGLTIEVYDETDALINTTTINTRNSDTQIKLNNTIAAGINRKIRIVGGGFHGILIDKIHLGFQENVSFAPNPLDSRTLQPVATPSSGQGTVGGGGPRGGGLCVVADTPIQLGGFYASEGEKEVQSIKNMMVEGENSSPNYVDDVTTGFARTRIVRTENGIEKECSESHRFRLNLFDMTGTPLYELRVGDVVQTNLDGKTEFSPIAYIGALSAEKKLVYTPRLRGGKYYLAGRWKPSWWQKILIALKLMRPKNGKIYAHNSKPYEIFL